MKLIHTLSCLLLAGASFVSCSLDTDAPPLNEPIYSGAAANITIAQLKTKYADVTDQKADTITDSLIVKAYVASTDQGGNIYKTMYVQDASGAIGLLVDQGDTYTTYRVGQEVYINLKGMVISSYGGEKQIGFPGAYLFRTPWADFQAHVLKNAWPDTAKVQPLEVSDISTLNVNAASNSGRLVRLTGVTFTGAGTLTFADASNYGSRTLTDASGNTMVVRTSNYADFATTVLPKGKGTVQGILGRYNGAWQLLIRTASDVYGFVDSGTPTDTTSNTGYTATTIFLEEFGTTVDKVNGNWPSVDIYTGWTNKNLTFSDPVMTGTFSRASIRTTGTLTSPHLWMASGYDSDLKIAGFVTAGYDSISLSYDIAANLATGATADQNIIGVVAGTNNLTVPSAVISNSNTFQNVSIGGLTPGFTSLTFVSLATTNTVGFRIDNIKLVGYKKSSNTTVITPN